eukprot:scaffold11812_cov137-Skeletonema_dohrnii-CCMP3373.AAC.6
MQGINLEVYTINVEVEELHAPPNPSFILTAQFCTERRWNLAGRQIESNLKGDRSLMMAILHNYIT